MVIKFPSKSRLFWTPLRCLKLDLCQTFQINPLTSKLVSGRLIFYLVRVVTLDMQAPMLIDTVYALLFCTRGRTTHRRIPRTIDWYELICMSQMHWGDLYMIEFSFVTFSCLLQMGHNCREIGLHVGLWRFGVDSFYF
jgi:hypothetical protein